MTDLNNVKCRSWLAKCCEKVKVCSKKFWLWILLKFGSEWSICFLKCFSLVLFELWFQFALRCVRRWISHWLLNLLRSGFVHWLMTQPGAIFLLSGSSMFHPFATFLLWQAPWLKTQPGAMFLLSDSTTFHPVQHSSLAVFFVVSTLSLHKADNCSIFALCKQKSVTYFRFLE